MQFGVAGQGESKALEYIVVHPANRGRGVAERLVEEACRMEEEKGVKQFEPGCGAIHRCLVAFGQNFKLIKALKLLFCE